MVRPFLLVDFSRFDISRGMRWLGQLKVRDAPNQTTQLTIPRFKISKETSPLWHDVARVGSASGVVGIVCVVMFVVDCS